MIALVTRQVISLTWPSAMLLLQVNRDPERLIRSDNHRLIWCPYIPEDEEESSATTADSSQPDCAGKLLVLTHDNVVSNDAQSSGSFTWFSLYVCLFVCLFIYLPFLYCFLYVFIYLLLLSFFYSIVYLFVFMNGKCLLWRCL